MPSFYDPFSETCKDIDFSSLNPSPPKQIINFDYELVVDAEVLNITSVIEYLEASILSDLSSRFLQSCVPNGDGRRQMRGMSRRNLEDTSDEYKGIVRIESTPIDLPDESIGKLIKYFYAQLKNE